VLCVGSGLATDPPPKEFYRPCSMSYVKTLYLVLHTSDDRIGAEMERKSKGSGRGLIEVLSWELPEKNL
jgi:hypothetical protein